MQTPQRNLSSTPRRSPFTGSGKPAPSALLVLGRLGRPAGPVAIALKIASPEILCALLWSQVWLGFSLSLALTASAATALLVLPRLLLAGGTGDSWVRYVGYGERIWLNRLILPVPQEAGQRITVLYLVFWTGAAVSLYGSAYSSAVLTLSGLAVAHAAQFACFRSLAALYRSMRKSAPLYRFWTICPGNDNQKSGKAAC